MTTPIEQTHKHVVAIHHAFVLRDDCEYNPILMPSALLLLGKREEELRYNVHFGWDDRLPDIAEKLVPIFKSAWTHQNRSPIPGDIRDDPDALRTITHGCKGLTQLGVAGHFRDPDYTLVAVLNNLVMYLQERERLLAQCIQMQLKPL
jgi:hypothetical protein